MVIAQLSDIHAAPDNQNLARLDRLLTWLDQITPDALVVSGDLIDDNWLEGYQAIAARLNQKSYPAFILPGNSDNREAMLSRWESQFRPRDLCSGALHFTADIGGIRLIGMDSTLAGSAAGSITQHLPWLEKTLSAEKTAASILFLHHHVFPSGIPTLDPLMCEGYQELGELLTRHPNRPLAIASGHVHRPMAGQLAGIPAYICGSVCPANPLWFGAETVPAVNDPPALMIHHFDHSSLVSHYLSV